MSGIKFKSEPEFKFKKIEKSPEKPLPDFFFQLTSNTLHPEPGGLNHGKRSDSDHSQQILINFSIPMNSRILCCYFISIVYVFTSSGMILGCLITERRHKGTQMKVVIVDNEPTILRSLEILIQSKVDGVNCFTNPNSALQFLKDHGHTVDILFADYFMPDMNGLELITRSLPFLKPKTVKVIMSGHIDLILHISDKNLPVDHLLSKPFDLDHVFSLLRLPNQIHTYEQQ